jgi:hypothetical protein
MSNQERTMAESIKEKLQDTGHKVAETASKAGHKAAEKMEEAADFMKEKAHQAGHRIEETAQKVQNKVAGMGDTQKPAAAAAGIREHMSVYGSCGNFLGKVDHVQDNSIKLTKNDSPDGQHHLIPLAWVTKVDDHVHLNKNCGEAKREWQDA